MTTSEIKSLVERATQEVWNSGNLDVLDDVYADDQVRHDPSQPEPIRGLEALKQYIGGFLAAFPDGHITVEDIIVDGDKFANRWTFRGTHEGEFAGIPPTGKQVEFTGTSFGRVANGKIVEVWDQADVLGLLEQLGVVPTEN